MPIAAYWELAAFLLLVVLYELWERLRPGWCVDRLAELRLDIVSFVVALACALAAREIIVSVAGRSAPASPGLETLRGLPFFLKLVLGLLAVDFCIYWAHRAQHRFAAGWRMHRWHHSVRQMYWLAGFRTSFLHSLIYNVPQILVPIHILALGPVETGVGYSIGLFVQFWNHANARARIGWLKHVFIRPQDHRVHHAADRSRAANFAFIFSIWDRCFGTYLDGDAVAKDYALGLGERVDPRTVPRMLLGA